ncbi:MAG: hypothetical protein KC492_22910 [Myxococcales bacterium]|nr:hypothetical protein [Myxococcales bacterium]
MALGVALLAPATAFAQGAAPEPPPVDPAAPEAQPAPGPGPQYYVEPAPETQTPPPPAQRQPPPPGYATSEPPPPIVVYEPQAPGVYEPPPPPRPRHLAPEYSLWLGGRIGYFHPFGNVWATCTAVDRSGICLASEGEEWQNYASSGPMGELDVGARLGRRHVLFFTWERAKLGKGDLDIAGNGEQQDAETDFFGLGLRFSSDPDNVGLLIEIVVGGRRFRTSWANGDELRLEDAPFESRIGIGADIRLSRAFSLSPMLTLGGGQFGTATYYNKATNSESEQADIVASHAWVTLQMGAHFDLLGSKN